MRPTIALVTVLFAACGSAPPYPAYAIEDDAEAVAQVVVADSLLLDVVRAGRPLVERVQPDDYLRVIVPVRNIDIEPIQVLAQVAFFDAQHRPIEDESNRQVMVLPAGGTQNFVAVSRKPEAADFVLRLFWNK